MECDLISVVELYFIKQDPKFLFFCDENWRTYLTKQQPLKIIVTITLKQEQNTIRTKENQHARGRNKHGLGLLEIGIILWIRFSRHGDGALSVAKSLMDNLRHGVQPGKKIGWNYHVRSWLYPAYLCTFMRELVCIH